MRRIRFNPWANLCALRDAALRLRVDPRFAPARVLRVLGHKKAEVFRLMVDVYTTLDEVIVRASVPGAAPEDIEIMLVDDQLVIQGSLKPSPENVDYVIRERRQGGFARTLSLKVSVDAARAEAQVDQGILTIVLPKAPSTRSKAIHVHPRGVS